MVDSLTEDVGMMSPLTEIDELEDDEEDPNFEYKVARMLRAPRNVQYSTQSLLAMMKQGEIDLDAPYQRDIVWQSDRQQGLIDSIIRNYYIPPLLFNLLPGPDGDEIRRCVDGKQRLTSIRLFMEGSMPYVDPDTNVRYWYGSPETVTKNSKKKFLPMKLQATFANKQMACVEYDNLTDFEEREVFQRVQKGVQLTTGERHQAMSTPVALYCHKLMNMFFSGPKSFKDNEHLKLKTPRYVEFEHVLRILWTADQMSTKALNETDIATAQKLEDWLSDYSAVVPEKVKAQMEKSFNLLLALAFHPVHRLVFKSKICISPVEFHAFGALLLQHADTLSTPDTARAISGLRKEISKLGTKRFRKDFIQLSYDFIVNLKPSKSGVVISKDPAILRLIPTHVVDTPSGLAPAPAPAPVPKRKWADDSDSDTPLMSKPPQLILPKKPSLAVITDHECLPPPPKKQNQSTQGPVKLEMSATPPLSTISLPVPSSQSPSLPSRLPSTVAVPSGRYRIQALNRLQSRTPSAGITESMQSMELTGTPSTNGSTIPSIAPADMAPGATSARKSRFGPPLGLVTDQHNTIHSSKDEAQASSSPRNETTTHSQPLSSQPKREREHDHARRPSSQYHRSKPVGGTWDVHQSSAAKSHRR